MIVQQFFLEGIAHSSYLLAGDKTAAIIDPRRDVQVYLDAAARRGLTITHILETHLHADFVSGHMDLADVTGAKIWAPAQGVCSFECARLSEGDNFEIEDMEISVLETPGHTPEHISYVVTDTGRGEQPVAVFCGDTLFVGDVGRPDLFPGRARELASDLYDSLHDKLLRLPGFCEVYPAHGAGSLCGRAMAAKRTSTIGYEALYNPALRIRDRTAFINSLTNDMPAAPDHFSRCSAINGAGPTLVSDLPPLEAMAATTFKELASREDTLVLDVRGFDSYGGMHIPGSWSIDLRTDFATLAGWVLPPDQDVLLVTDGEDQAEEAAVSLRRVGIDRIPGYLKGGMLDWVTRGLTVDRVPLISADTFVRMSMSEQPLVLLDVRSAEEYEKKHIAGSASVPAPDIRTRYREFDPKKGTAVICGSGRRSSVAASILKMHGFSHVFNVAGGMTGYEAAGHPTE